MDIVWLGEPACHDRAVVGGKAAHLSALAAGHRVPPGFCVTVEALHRALAGGLVPHDESGAVPTPPRLQDTVVRAYQDLAERCGTDALAVAVRSSAVEEDGAMASYAGQYVTCLNVVSAGDVVQATQRCWASAAAPGMLAYRRHQGLDGARARLAVLIQQLIVADVAAVVFSAHPATSNRDEVVINASWGLGASVVGGTVTPDTYVVRKADLAVLVRQIADKSRMTVAIPGGTCEVGVPRLLRIQPALDGPPDRRGHAACPGPGAADGVACGRRMCLPTRRPVPVAMPAYHGAVPTTSLTDLKHRSLEHQEEGDRSCRRLPSLTHRLPHPSLYLPTFW